LAAAAVLATAPAGAQVRSFRAVRQLCGVATFKVDRIDPATIRSARVRLAGRERAVPIEAMRAAARRGVLRARLPGGAGSRRDSDRRLCRIMAARRHAIRFAARAGAGGSFKGHKRRYWLRRARVLRVEARRRRLQLRARYPSGPRARLIVTTKAVSPQAQPPAGATAIAAAGDIAAQGGVQQATSDLLLALRPDAVLTLGDNAYEEGSLAQYQSYYDPSWGRLKAITRPSPGNHEYLTPNAAGYFTYFGNPPPYYSFDLGTWHLISLDSSISMSAGSPQETWLRADIAGHRNNCTLAYWHHPHFTDGPHKPDDSGSETALWNALYSAGADVVLNGHDHSYQRWAPKTPSGADDPQTGIREFVVGTGGRNHTTPTGTGAEVRDSMTFGVLEMTLRPAGYDWQFVPVPGGTFRDQGSGACH
jgi:hypothetical protein